MRQALTTPVLGSIALGAMALTFSLLRPTTESECVARRLVLHAEQRPDAIYLTAFASGERTIRATAGALRPITFEIRGTLPDGCRWLGTETLVPLDERTYRYEYSEAMLDCEPGAIPQYYATPRTGFVTLEAL